MDSYIGTKLIKAEPAWKTEVLEDGAIEIITKAERPSRSNLSNNTQDGYKIKYIDGYTSWSPKDTFEKSHLLVEENSNLKTNISVSEKMVEDFIGEVIVSTLGTKTTIVKVTLVNGFEIVESSSCVDKANYNEKIGSAICLEKIKDKVWFLLGFLLQTAVQGVDGDK